MKNTFLAAVAVAFVLLTGQRGFADQTNVIADLNALIIKVNAKLGQGSSTEADLTPELKGFDALYAKYKDQKTDDVAQILAMKAQLYLEVIQDPEKAAEILQQIKRDLPDTETGKRMDAVLAELKPQIDAEKIRRSLRAGTQFPTFDVKDVSGRPLSLASHKGKVVLVEFWATWCVPCRMELPYVLQTYKKYHASGFEIIGVSLDDDPLALARFIKENDLTWPQYNDGKKFENALAMKYGVESIPTNYLLDGDGKIIGMDLREDDLEAAVAGAVAKK
jgi:thiol-disulfide isomerase/thioredoxin